MKTLIVIGGPTASGKTGIAIEVATRLGTEILSADSRQCYRELNIGVAKPTSDQLARIPHHFINSHSIHDEVNAGNFERFGMATIEKIFEKSDYAVCAGGTGLYIKALCDGIDEMPDVERAIDSEVQKQYEEQGIAWLQEKLKSEDPVFASAGEMQNPARMIRALVFKRSTGHSLIDFRKSAKKKRPFEIRYFTIHQHREALYNAIESRVDDMIKQGLEDEAISLFPFRQLKALQTVGYQEWYEYLDGKYDWITAVNKIKQHTRNYAKRQVTWFRHQQEFIQVPPRYENIIKALS